MDAETFDGPAAMVVVGSRRIPAFCSWLVSDGNHQKTVLAVCRFFSDLVCKTI